MTSQFSNTWKPEHTQVDITLNHQLVDKTNRHLALPSRVLRSMGEHLHLLCPLFDQMVVMFYVGNLVKESNCIDQIKNTLFSSNQNKDDKRHKNWK